MAKNKTAAPAQPVISPAPDQAPIIQNPATTPQTEQLPVTTPETISSTVETNPMFQSLSELTQLNPVDQNNPVLNPETIKQIDPQFQESENPAEPKKIELTFEEKVKLKARMRNAARSVNKLKDALLSLVNPVQPEDNPDRA